MARPNALLFSLCTFLYLQVTAQTGNVGIGVDTPQAKLHVAGNILSTGDFIQVKDGNQAISLITNATQGYVNLDVGGTGHSSDDIILGEAGDGNPNKIGIGTSNPLAALHIDAPLNQQALRVEIDGNTKLYVRSNGNLGVNEPFPSEQLHVDGNILAENFFGDVNMRMLAANASSSSLKLLESGGFGFEFEYDGSPDQLYLHSRGFSGNDGVRMTWLKDGKVGIGTTNPQQLLHVGGNILSTGGYVQAKDGSQAISMVPNAAGGYVILDVGGTGHASDHIILGESGSGSLNKVGIGTNNPGGAISNALLEVSGGHIALKNNFGIFSNNNAGTGIGAGFDTDTDDDLFLFAGGSNRMTVGANGNVGIATNTPEYPLHIESPGTSGQTIAMVVESAVAQRPVILFSEANSNHTLDSGMSLEYDGTGSGNTNKFRINKVGGNPAVTIENGGEIGINIVSPAAPLHILQVSDDNKALRIEHPTNTNFWDIGMSLADLIFSYNGTVKSYIEDANGSYNTLSDVRLKQDVSPLPRLLDKVTLLNPTSYRYKSHPEEQHKSFGFIAQEVESLFPEVVSENNGYKAINYDAFAAIAIQAIKELADRNDQFIDLVGGQQEIIQKLERKNTQLENRLSRLEKVLEKH